MVAVTGIMGWLSVRQVRVWNNSESLFTHMIVALKDDPYRQDIYWRLGKYLYDCGRYGEAIGAFENTIKLNPHHGIAHNYLARLEKMRRNDAAASERLRMLRQSIQP
jgi:tetratricopeptide (TPR) repeat protein